MALERAEILFNNSDSTHNKDLCSFLDRNLNNIVKKAKLQLTFNIVQKSDMDDLRESGITRLPAMRITKLLYIGVPNIIDELMGRIKRCKIPAPNKSEDEEVREYMEKMVTDGLTKKGDTLIFEDEDDIETPDFNKLTMKELEKRAESTGTNPGPSGEQRQPDTGSRPDNLDLDNFATSMNKDDEMMLKSMMANNINTESDSWRGD